MAMNRDDKPLEELFKHTLELNKKYLSQGVKVLRRMSNSENLRKDMFTFKPNMYSRALNSFAKMNLEYYNKMLEFGLSMADEFFNRGEGGTVVEPSFVLSGSGKAGEAVTLQFVLENTKSETVQCELVNSPFVEENHPDVAADITASFEPQSFSQQPGESHRVSITLQIHEDTQPGTYISDMKVVGFDTSYFSLVLTVEPPVRKPTHAKSKKRPSKKS